MKPGVKPRSAAVRLWERMGELPHEDACWPWPGYTTKGYGVIAQEGVKLPAHRVAYESFYGPIPEGMDLDHVCHNKSDCPGGVTCVHRKCVNPHHLEPVTHLENVRRGKAAKRGTHCSKGHELTDDNLYAHKKPSGRISYDCRTCALARANARYKELTRW